MITKILAVKLTTNEEHRKGKEAAAIARECITIQIEIGQLKQAAKDKQKLIDEKQSTIAQLHHEVDTGQEFREVQCQEERDEVHMVVNTVRLDTGEIIATRAFTLDERQQPLPFVREV